RVALERDAGAVSAVPNLPSALPAMGSLRQTPQHFLQPALSNPLLEAPMAGLVRRIPLRHLAPARPAPQHPQHTVEYPARVLPRSPAAVLASLRLQDRPDQLPILVAYVPASAHTPFRSSRAFPPLRIPARLSSEICPRHVY